MLPEFHEGQYVFVVGTGSAERDWAAAEYVTTPKYVRELVGRLRRPTGKLPEAYQALIRIKFSGQCRRRWRALPLTYCSAERSRRAVKRGRRRLLPAD
jgi:hypothetical protein